MLIKDVLRELDLGSSVAEHDEALEDYFIETDVFRALVEDRRDTIAGDKGTGKTALYRILQKRYPSLLADVEVLPGFNPAGAPVFQRLTEGEPMSEHHDLEGLLPVAGRQLDPAAERGRVQPQDDRAGRAAEEDGAQQRRRLREHDLLADREPFQAGHQPEIS